MCGFAQACAGTCLPRYTMPNNRGGRSIEEEGAVALSEVWRYHQCNLSTGEAEAGASGV